MYDLFVFVKNYLCCIIYNNDYFFQKPDAMVEFIQSFAVMLFIKVTCFIIEKYVETKCLQLCVRNMNTELVYK